MPRTWLRYRHWTYVWIPVAAAFIWFATLWALIITWLVQGRPRYVSMDGKIAYISDVGADILKPLFIVGCSITAVGFFLSLFTERWLRHSGRLMPNMRRRERIFGTLAVLGSVIGGAGLILLSIFDTKRHMRAHRGFLLMFMIGVVMSAVFTIIEYRWISKDYAGLRSLQRAYKAKALIAGILILLAIAFAVTLFTAVDVGAILEWTIAFGFTFYLLTFFTDLRMSKNVQKGALTQYKHGLGTGSNGSTANIHNGPRMTQIA